MAEQKTLAASKPKRERKPKTWDGFEVDLADRKIFSETKGTGSKAKLASPKGRGRPAKVKPVSPTVNRETLIEVAGGGGSDSGAKSHPNENSTDVTQAVKRKTLNKIDGGVSFVVGHADVAASSVVSGDSVDDKCHFDKDTDGVHNPPTDNLGVKSDTDNDCDGLPDKSIGNTCHPAEGISHHSKGSDIGKSLTSHNSYTVSNSVEGFVPPKSDTGKLKVKLIETEKQKEDWNISLETHNASGVNVKETVNDDKKKKTPERQKKVDKETVGIDNISGKELNQEEVKKKTTPAKSRIVDKEAVNLGKCEEDMKEDGEIKITPGRPKKSLGRKSLDQVDEAVADVRPAVEVSIQKKQQVRHRKVVKDSNIKDVDESSREGQLGPADMEALRKISQQVTQMRNGERNELRRCAIRKSSEDGMNADVGEASVAVTVGCDDIKVDTGRELESGVETGFEHLPGSSVSTETRIEQLGGMDNVVEVKPKQRGRLSKGTPKSSNQQSGMSSRSHTSGVSSTGNYAQDDKSGDVEDGSADADLIDSTPKTPASGKKRGRKPKIVRETDSETVSVQRKTPGRKRKVVNYAAMNDGKDKGDDDDDDNDNDDDGDCTEDAADDKEFRETPKRRGRPPKVTPTSSSQLSIISASDAQVDGNGDGEDGKTNADLKEPTSRTPATGKKRGRKPKNKTTNIDNSVQRKTPGRKKTVINYSSMIDGDDDDDDDDDFKDEDDGDGDDCTVDAADDKMATETPKRRGRPPKGTPKSSNQTTVSNPKTNTSDVSSIVNDTQGEANDNGGVCNNVTDLSDFTPKTPVTGKKRGRKPKGTGTSNGENDFIQKKTPGRKRKVVDYSVMNERDYNDGEGDDDDCDIDNDYKTEAVDETPKRMGRKRRKPNEDIPEDNYETPRSAGRKRPTKPPVTYKCVHCSFEGQGISRHMAVEHQLWWSKDNPEGGSSRADLGSVFKVKKCLNCPKCSKQINQLFYYFNHLEWCGREDETYVCEDCGKGGLKARWRHIHERDCPELRLRRVLADDSDDVKSPDDERKEFGRGQKRSAATKALTIVNQLAKQVIDSDLSGDDTDDDPDVDLRNVEEEEEDEEDFEEGEEMLEEEEDKDGDEESWEEDENEAKREKKERRLARVQMNKSGVNTNRQEPANLLSYMRYCPTYKLMYNYYKRHLSTSLFEEWLPRKQDCQILSPSESLPYLPKDSSRSVQFRFKSNNELGNLNSLSLYESVLVQGYPIFYTGLSVWKVSWCPQPRYSTNKQYLAVIGKTDPSSCMFTGHRYEGPGVIQVWKFGSLKGTSTNVPSLCYTVAHDYGHATDLQWCPSGCYTRDSKEEFYPRLGLLAVAFTDASVRIFSMPQLDLTVEENREAPTVRLKPIRTLLLHLSVAPSNQLTCSCLDWKWSQGHSQIMAGYSNGIVRLYNLSAPTHSSKTTGDDSCLLPCRSFVAHGKTVRAVRWCGLLDNIVVSSSEDYDLIFWDLNDTRFPISGETVTWFTIHLCQSLWFPGVFVASDDNYAVNSNRTRYFEALSLMYTHVSRERKEEITQYIILAQPACVWEVSYSNWLNYLLACDNRGCVLAKPMSDLMVHVPDTKQYKYRLCLFKTTVHQKNEKVEVQSKEESLSPNKMCPVCKSSQSDSDLTKFSQSDPCKSCETNQSEQCNSTESDKSKQSLHIKHGSLVESVSVNDTEPQKVCEKSKGLESKSSDETGTVKEKICDNENSGSCDIANDKSSSGTEDLILEFEEHLQVPCCGLGTEKNEDKLDAQTPAALKTISFNPNHLQCMWCAFGGDAGLVRVVNTQAVMPVQLRLFLKKMKDAKNAV